MVKQAVLKKFLALAIIVFLFSLPALVDSASSTIFSDGFEGGNFSNWTYQIGTPTLSRNPVHGGNYAANFSFATACCYAIKTITPTSVLNYTYFVYFKALPTNFLCVVLALDTNGTEIYYRVQSSNGAYQWRFSVGTTQIINASTPSVTSGQWYKIQLLATTGSNSTLYFLVNDQLKATITNQTLGQINQLRTGNDWIDFGSYQPQGETYFDDVEATNSITSFISAYAEAGGSITPSGAVNVPLGGNQTFDITADANCHIEDVFVDDTSVGAVSQYTFTNVQTIHSIRAIFEPNTYTITASAGANGAITPSGDVIVNADGSQTFTLTPNTGYHLADVIINGTSVASGTSYTFSDVHASYTIVVTFAADPTSTTTTSTTTTANPTPTPKPTATPTPTPTPTASPTAAPSPSASPPVQQSASANMDYTPFIIGGVVVIAAAGAAALFLTRRKRNVGTTIHIVNRP